MPSSIEPTRRCHEDPTSTPGRDPLLPVVGEATRGVIEMARAFAGRGEILLISGPTGSGKSRLARWCHEQSPRRAQRFETLDLLSVPEDLQMAELVGWKRGAFTGATQSVAGALTRAARGTLFIDEVDKLSLKAQAGLLRILEERRYRALGDGTDELRADVQFIIGTNVDLRRSVREGRFREDLYYRINVLPVRLPPLAERLDEVPEWAAFMLERCCGGAADGARLAPEAIAALGRHFWPGNLRQLDNVIRRAHALATIGREPSSGEAVGEVVVGEQHVARALAFEGAERPSMTAHLWCVASALAGEIVRRSRSGGESMTLEVLDGFRGMVLGAVVQHLDSREEAFRLFEREYLLAGRNHHRALKRELGRTRELVDALGDDVDDPRLSALLQLGAMKRRRTSRPRAWPELELVR